MDEQSSRQVFQWINKGIKNFDEMTNLSKFYMKMKNNIYHGYI